MRQAKWKHQCIRLQDIAMRHVVQFRRKFGLDLQMQAYRKSKTTCLTFGQAI